MTAQQLCERIAHDLDRLTDAFLLEGRRAAAYKTIELNCTLLGESMYGEEESSPMEVAQKMAEGGVE